MCKNPKGGGVQGFRQEITYPRKGLRRSRRDRPTSVNHNFDGYKTFQRKPKAAGGETAVAEPPEPTRLKDTRPLEG